MGQRCTVKYNFDTKLVSMNELNLLHYSCRKNFKPLGKTFNLILRTRNTAPMVNTLPFKLPKPFIIS